MASITRATAFCNDEIAYLARAAEPAAIPGCLGFNMVREHLADAVEAELSGGKRARNSEEAKFDGFLNVTDAWREPPGRRLSASFTS